MFAQTCLSDIGPCVDPSLLVRLLNVNMVLLSNETEEQFGTGCLTEYCALISKIES